MIAKKYRNEKGPTEFTPPISLLSHNPMGLGASNGVIVVDGTGYSQKPKRGQNGTLKHIELSKFIIY